MEIINHKLKDSAGVERTDGAVDSKQPDVEGNKRKMYIIQSNNNK